MRPERSVLISLAATPAARSEAWRARLASWVEDLGYEPAVTEDALELVGWVRTRAFAASLLESALVGEGGERVWRTVRPIVGRRLVLMAREPGNDLWFEALRLGVGAVLPLPPEPAMVRAALEAVAAAPAPGLCEPARGGLCPPVAARVAPDGPEGRRGVRPGR